MGGTEVSALLEVSIQTAARRKGATANSLRRVAELLFASFCNGLVLPRLPHHVSFLWLRSCPFTRSHLGLLFLPFYSSKAVFPLFLGSLERLTFVFFSPHRPAPTDTQIPDLFLTAQTLVKGCVGLCCHCWSSAVHFPSHLRPFLYHHLPDFLPPAH